MASKSSLRLRLHFCLSQIAPHHRIPFPFMMTSIVSNSRGPASTGTLQNLGSSHVLSPPGKKPFSCTVRRCSVHGCMCVVSRIFHKPYGKYTFWLDPIAMNAICDEPLVQFDTPTCVLQANTFRCTETYFPPPFTNSNYVHPTATSVHMKRTDSSTTSTLSVRAV